MCTRCSADLGRCSTPASFSWLGRCTCDRKPRHKATQLLKRDKSVHLETCQNTEQENMQKGSYKVQTHGCAGHE